MVKVIKKNWLIILILVVAAFIRLYKLSVIPSSLDWDEVAIGWNAKTIFHTRRDEFGKLLPLTFQSFGDFKAPFLIYLTTLFVGLFGLSELAVRLPSVLSSLVTIITVYLLAKEISTKLNIQKRYQTLFPYLSTILITLSPWHYFFSRPAFEPNIALMWITLGTYLFIKGISSYKFIPLSGLAFLASLYTYHSPKLFLPPFLLILFTLFFKPLMSQFKKHSKFYFITIVILIASSLPIIYATFSGSASSRATTTTILYDDQNNPRNLDVSFIKDLSSNYLTHLTPQFYLKGTHSNYRLGLKNSGIMTYAQWLGLISGITLLLFSWKNKYAKLILLWFLLAIFPSTLGKDIMPNNLRSLNMLPAATLTSAYGLIFIFSKLKNIKLKSVIALLLIVFYSFQTTTTLKEYFIDFPVYSAPDWQYGYQQAVDLASQYEDEVDKITITTHYGEPHVFTYFYQKRDPQSVFWGGLINYRFRSINWEQDKNMKKNLFIGSPDEIPINDSHIINIIYYPDKTPAFVVAKT
jgi:4-amino-4-deoxy-L-arabinose transferase-like glycosyltransferase